LPRGATGRRVGAPRRTSAALLWRVGRQHRGGFDLDQRAWLDETRDPDERHGWIVATEPGAPRVSDLAERSSVSRQVGDVDGHADDVGWRAACRPHDGEDVVERLGELPGELVAPERAA